MFSLMPNAYHQPVMLKESLEGLNIDPSGIYLDLTFGGGGHTTAILERLKTGRLIAFDKDPEALPNAAMFASDERFKLVQSDFRYVEQYLHMHGIQEVDGILADLGVSSHQIDSPERGFSTRYDAVLDMRMSKGGEKTAATILNTYSPEDLQQLFSRYGEVRNARTLAQVIAEAREQDEIHTIDRLKEVVGDLAPRGRENRYFAQVFQSLRIAVNDELGALEDMLVAAERLLKVGGRLVVISYHSLEDRLVKNVMRSGNIEGIIEKDFYGNARKVYRQIITKPLTASEEEVKSNPRARSAKLRVAEKLNGDG